MAGETRNPGNLPIHKSTRNTWLAQRMNMQFFYPWKHSSWPNRIEIRFSILTGRALKSMSLRGAPELKAHIKRTITNDNERPFVWTKNAVHQKRLKPCFAV